jgi:hypothetical protein
MANAEETAPNQNDALGNRVVLVAADRPMRCRMATYRDLDVLDAAISLRTTSTGCSTCSVVRAVRLSAPFGCREVRLARGSPVASFGCPRRSAVRAVRLSALFGCP